MKIEDTKDFKAFIEKNREKLYKRAVKIEDFPSDDDWIQDDVWDEVYQQEVIKKKGESNMTYTEQIVDRLRVSFVWLIGEE